MVEMSCPEGTNVKPALNTSPNKKYHMMANVLPIDR
jgi:hypothetical protein